MASSVSVADALWQRLSSPVVILPIVVLLAWNAYRAFTARAPVPSDLPWVGKDSEGPIAEIAASFKSFNHARDWLKEGYEKVESTSTREE